MPNPEPEPQSEAQPGRPAPLPQTPVRPDQPRAPSDPPVHDMPPRNMPSHNTAPLNMAPYDMAPYDMAQTPDIADMMRGGPRRQAMRGFDETYVDIVDYIIRVTHRIWEERSVGDLYHSYQHNIAIHTSEGMTYGRDQVIADTVAMMSAFPDLRLFGDEVIWSGDENAGFHSSHRITWTATNTGYSKYGPPTGRRVLRRGIAHCLVRENRIFEEWISRDELALIRQLGLDEWALARKFARLDARRAGSGPLQSGPAEVNRLNGQLPPDTISQTDAETDLEYAARLFWHEVWNWRLLDTLRVHLSPNHVAFVSTNRRLDGLNAYGQWVLSLLAAFPDGAMQIDHVCSTGRRVALRWRFTGTHLGPGWYGDPTGKRVNLLGITHLEEQDGTFRREFSIFDEFALLKQIVDLEG